MIIVFLNGEGLETSSKGTKTFSLDLSLFIKIDFAKKEGVSFAQIKVG